MIWQYVLGFVVVIIALIIGIYIGAKFVREEKDTIKINYLSLADRSLNLIFRYRVLILIYRTMNPFDVTRSPYSRAYRDLIALWFQLDQKLIPRNSLHLEDYPSSIEFLNLTPSLKPQLIKIFESDQFFAKTILKLVDELERFGHEGLYSILRLVLEVKSEEEIFQIYQRYSLELDLESIWRGDKKSIADMFPSISDPRFNRLHGDSTTDAPPPKKNRKNK